MFALPQDLARAGLALRPVEARDHAFLRALFETARLDAPFLAQWPARERQVFLDSQFQFQDAHYRGAFTQADFLVVERHGVPIGRLILDRGPRDWRVVDIGFLPASRGQGLGSALLRAIQAAAAVAGATTVSLHVETGNRARAVYDRLGFVEIDDGDDSGTHIAMTWPVS